MTVFQAMFQKAVIPDDHFKKYLEVLLGNKDDEKVTELTSNTLQNSRPKRRDCGHHCYSFGAYRHFQATCPFRRRYKWSLPSRMLVSCKQGLWV